MKQEETLLHHPRKPKQLWLVFFIICLLFLAGIYLSLRFGTISYSHRQLMEVLRQPTVQSAVQDVVVDFQLRRLAGGRDAVVAGRATAGDAGMVEAAHRCPRGGGVAGIAGCARDDVSGRLAGRLHVVVAGRAAAAHLGVFEARHRPEGHGGMAGLAALGADDVRGRLGDGADVLAQWHHEPFRQYPGCNGPLVGFGFMADGLEPAVERKQAAHAAARFAGWRTPETGLG